MRRSFAPSSRSNNQPTSTCSHSGVSNLSKRLSTHSNPHQSEDGEIVISRMPMFNFLEIPEALNKQFKIPSGCIITEKTLELRKIKRLGPPKQFQIVRPGDFLAPFLRPQSIESPSDLLEENGEDVLPSSAFPPFEPLVLWTDPEDSLNTIEVIPLLASKLRPHQREGVQFLFECTMGLRGFEGQGCILADDMGLGKTLMSITAMWTLLNQGFRKNQPAVHKVMIVCPTSLVGNWDNEIRKWVGDSCPTYAVKTEPKKMIKNYLQSRQRSVLIISYETQRLYSKMFENQMKIAPHNEGSNGVCDLLICDEAHKLKNAESGLAVSLNALPAKKRILLSGTPMQNELAEFFNMVNFCNPNILGSLSEFRRKYERPILAAREPDAIESEISEAAKLQKELSVIVNEFILKRGNILNAQHLPPKLVQFVCCRLTPLQEQMYERLLSSKEIRHIKEGKQTNTLNSIRQLINICSHPQLVLETYQRKVAEKEPIDDDLAAIVELIPKSSSHEKPGAPDNKQILSKPTRASPHGKIAPKPPQKGLSLLQGMQGHFIDPEQSGKMAVLFRMMQAMRATQNQERIVIVSNYTSTLDLIESMCQQSRWPALRLDGTISATKRTKLVEEFNNPHSNAFAFLLSSKAGGCGINLIGGNRLVLFDPDWNPAADKQAAGRIWREGQKRRCFIYRFMSTGTIEEKIIQRQLSKEGLADIVDDKEQINSFSTDELRQLFTYRKETKSDTHDTLRCQRCSFMKNRVGLQNHSSKAQLSDFQTGKCLEFLEKFEKFLQGESYFYQKRILRRGNSLPTEMNQDGMDQNLLMQQAKDRIDQSLSVEEDSIELPFQGILKSLKQQLNDKVFPNLTIFSRKQRETMQAIEKELTEANISEDLQPNENVSDAMTNIAYKNLFAPSFSLYSEFLRQWTDLVPALLSTNPTMSEEIQTNGGVAMEGFTSAESSVEQEGCPEDTDLNKWSHHCYAITCDDELFGKALGDDLSLVSFIFGLEINFSLLQMRELEMREENERRKEQQKKDLEELNSRRRKEKAELVNKDLDEMISEDLETTSDSVSEEIAEVPKQKVVDSKSCKARKTKGSEINVPIEDRDNPQVFCDLVKVMKALSKEKKKVTFEEFWKCLKRANNNWRLIESSETKLFTCIPGLKHANLNKYQKGGDYFLGENDFLLNIMKVISSAKTPSAVEPLSEMVKSLIEEQRFKDLSSDYFDEISKENKEDSMNEEVDVHVSRKTLKRKSISLDDSSEDEDLQEGKRKAQKVSDNLLDSGRLDKAEKSQCNEGSKSSSQHSADSISSSTVIAWDCEFCTFHNERMLKYCEICRFKNSNFKK